MLCRGERIQNSSVFAAFSSLSPPYPISSVLFSRYLLLRTGQQCLASAKPSRAVRDFLYLLRNKATRLRNAINGQETNQYIVRGRSVYCFCPFKYSSSALPLVLALSLPRTNFQIPHISLIMAMNDGRKPAERSVLQGRGGAGK